MSGALLEGFERWQYHVLEKKQVKEKAFKVVHRKAWLGNIIQNCDI
jgi:hypothetical protein